VQLEQPRIYLFDNLKAILITLVVFGHIIEPFAVGWTKIAYIFIYTFHMPLFIFCSGYFAACNPQKILTHLLYPYILFQSLYYLLQTFLLKDTVAFQFTTPYWILWYLFALIVWVLLIPLLERFTHSKKGFCALIVCSLLVGIASGCFDDIGYYMSLSRIACFFPFFVLGFCLKRANKLKSLLAVVSHKTARLLLAALVAVILLAACLYYNKIELSWLYGSKAYRLDIYFCIRMLVYLCAAIISLFLISIVPRGKVFFTFVGQHSLPVYLFHGFLMRFFSEYSVLSSVQNPYFRLFLAGLLSLAIVFLLSSYPFRKVVSPLLAFPFAGRSVKA